MKSCTPGEAGWHMFLLSCLNILPQAKTMTKCNLGGAKRNFIFAVIRWAVLNPTAG
ncbi:MAG: hypothetical protein PQJ46_07450 [Spirochaetales bacterium]|nr:hypothetical protein [Spirochaetales bacterium]